jgi:hypothetical protein
MLAKTGKKENLSELCVTAKGENILSTHPRKAIDTMEFIR